MRLTSIATASASAAAFVLTPALLVSHFNPTAISSNRLILLAVSALAAVLPGICVCIFGWIDSGLKFWKEYLPSASNAARAAATWLSLLGVPALAYVVAIVIWNPVTPIWAGKTNPITAPGQCSTGGTGSKGNGPSYRLYDAQACAVMDARAIQAAIAIAVLAAAFAIAGSSAAARTRKELRLGDA